MDGLSSGVLNASHLKLQLILTTAPEGNYYYHSCFTVKETEAQLYNWSKVTELGYGPSEPGSQSPNS